MLKLAGLLKENINESDSPESKKILDFTINIDKQAQKKIDELFNNLQSQYVSKLIEMVGNYVAGKIFNGNVIKSIDAINIYEKNEEYDYSDDLRVCTFSVQFTLENGKKIFRDLELLLDEIE